MGSMGDSLLPPGVRAAAARRATRARRPTLYSVDGATREPVRAAERLVPGADRRRASTTRTRTTTRAAQASANAAVNGPLATGIHDFVSCPKPTQPTGGSGRRRLVPDRASTADTRVDLWLVRRRRERPRPPPLPLGRHACSRSRPASTADENIVKCLTAGDLLRQGQRLRHARSEYLLDQHHDARDLRHDLRRRRARGRRHVQPGARRPRRRPTRSTGNMICPNDDDWYKVRLFDRQDAHDGPDVHAERPRRRTSTSTSTRALHRPVAVQPAEPVDVHAGARPGRGVERARASTRCRRAATAGCDYYVVVRGYDGSTNSYGITLEIQ